MILRSENSNSSISILVSKFASLSPLVTFLVLGSGAGSPGMDSCLLGMDTGDPQGKLFLWDVGRLAFLETWLVNKVPDTLFQISAVSSAGATMEETLAPTLTSGSSSMVASTITSSNMPHCVASFLRDKRALHLGLVLLFALLVFQDGQTSSGSYGITLSNHCAPACILH